MDRGHTARPDLALDRVPAANVAFERARVSIGTPPDR
jgi:hypothetical protein